MKTNLEKIFLTTTIICLIIIGFLAYVILKPNGVLQKNRAEEVKTIEELSQKTNINIAKPQEDDKITSYKILNDDASEITYKHENVDFIYRATKNAQLDIARTDEEWDPQYIAMNVKFDDDTSLEIKTYRSKTNYAKLCSEWEDNDYFYTIQSNNATNNEIFLKEVNRIAKENHIIGREEAKIRESIATKEIK